jgi:hypothetical protein
MDDDIVSRFNEDFNILSWWHEHKLTYHIHSLIAKDGIVGTLDQGYPLLQYEDIVHVRRLQATRRTAPCGRER